MEGPPHVEGCACLREVLALMTKTSPKLLELVEAWTLEEYDKRN